MMLFVTFGLLVSIFSSLTISTCARSVPKELLWWPVDDGYAPAFLNSAARGLVVPAADASDIHFYLFTKHNAIEYDEIFNTTESIVASHWDVNAPVKIFAHGFGSGFDGGSGEATKQGYITNEYPTNVNLILIQWKKLAASPFYDAAARNTKIVGEEIAYLLTFLVENKFTTLAKIHVSGHSLGAHVAGFAGRFYQEMNPGKIIPRITGHDPALPLFGLVDDSERIDPTDGEFVDIIHTASGTILEGELGFLEPRGTIDFYPNSGRNQPGCYPDTFGACSHSRCYLYFAESIQSDLFRACKCADDAWDPDVGDNFKSCSCDKGSANMGEWTSSNASGVYYLTTNSQPPFAMG